MSANFRNPPTPELFDGPGTDQPLLPNPPSFSGHQTFAMRSSWLKKGLDAVLINPHIFADEDALVKLGVGKNMVTAIRYWLLACQLAETAERSGELRPTALGTMLLTDNGADPYLEDPATLWLLHWNLCGPGSQAYTWAYAFNVFRDWEWSAASLSGAVQTAARAASARTSSAETIDRDVNVFLQTYVATTDRNQNAEDGLDCPLRELGLLRTGFGGSSQYSFTVGPKPSLPVAIFAWALQLFWNWQYPGTSTVAARDIAHAEGSPGMVFKLDEDSTLAYLDQLEALTDGDLRFEDTPLVRQVVRTAAAPLSADSLLRLHYAPAPLAT